MASTIGDGYEVSRYGETLDVDICYPRCEGDRVREVLIGLMDVRASDGILVSYDFERDGWVIKQASNWTGEAGADHIDYDYQEVAFIQSWARDKRNGTEDEP